MPAPPPASPFADPAVVARYEDWYATPYGRVADRIERALLRELLQPLAPPASILDLGCGTGHFSADLAAQGFRVVGVDPEHAMLRTARERLAVARADGLHLPFADGTFDAVTVVAVLDFVADPAALLREARRVARTRVAVLALASDSYLGFRRRLAGRRGHPIFARAKFRTRAELLAAARAAGAQVERLRTAMFLPPLLAGRFPRFEESLSRAARPGGGVLGLALSGAGDR